MKTISIDDRVSKVDRSHLAPVPKPLPMELLDIFPDVLAARSLRLLVERIVAAHKAGRPVLFTMGAHPIKCGLNPVLIELMRKGVLTGIATNGASVVHDIEMSRFGQTSEDVLPSLEAGTFGVTSQTHKIFQMALTEPETEGLGPAVGNYLLRYQDGSPDSLFAQAYRCGGSVTVHVSFGADVLHMDRDLDAATLGIRTKKDFWTFRNRVWRVAEKGGVIVNWGSAVMMPEVLLKAIGSVCNAGYEFKDLTMADFDMNKHYRPQTRIVDVANELGGTGLSITGHHEIMMPLVACLVLGAIE
jgi:hypothetical protein